MDTIALESLPRRLPRGQIENQIKICNPLPSLTCTNQSLCELLAVEQRYTSQISDVIRNDPSLSARILQLVNSAYFGLATPVRGIAEAVFYLGLDQVRQLALITPVIDDFRSMVEKVPFTWRGFWQHSIGTAIMVREVTKLSGRESNETDYLAGLLHDVGKIAMASVFTSHFIDIQQCVRGVLQDLQEVERFVLGIDHAELGAMYLRCHSVPEVFVAATAFHHQPELAPTHASLAAAVQIADLLAREGRLGASGNPNPVSAEDCLESTGWRILFGEQTEVENRKLLQQLVEQVRKLPSMLDAIV